MFVNATVTSVADGVRDNVYDLKVEYEGVEFTLSGYFKEKPKKGKKALILVDSLNTAKLTGQIIYAGNETGLYGMVAGNILENAEERDIKDGKSVVKYCVRGKSNQRDKETKKYPTLYVNMSHFNASNLVPFLDKDKPVVAAYQVTVTEGKDRKGNDRKYLNAVNRAFGFIYTERNEDKAKEEQVVEI